MLTKRKADGLSSSASQNLSNELGNVSKAKYRNFEIFAAARCYMQSSGLYLLERSRLADKAGLGVHKLDENVLAILRFIKSHRNRCSDVY